MSMEVEGSLVITQVDEDDDAKYQCLAKNVVGTRGSEKAQLSVLGKYLLLLCKSTKKLTFSKMLFASYFLQNY